MSSLSKIELSGNYSEPSIVGGWEKRLLSWYHRNKRDMPWREEPTPYRVWISEIMLQQTQVDTVRPYFDRFVSRFPDIRALAEADQKDVLKSWEGLGYYSRARNLYKAARLLGDDDAFPDTYETLLELPGIGPYTAAAIASIAFGLPHAVVDGNVLRVFSRFWAVDSDIARNATRKQILDRLQKAIIRAGDPSAFNQAMMELGALICRPARPACDECPLSCECVAALSGQPEAFPVKKKRPPIPHYHVSVALVRYEGDVLIAQREDHKMLGGLWEFPGGKVEPGESPEQAVQREVLEETGLNVAVREKICTVEHAYSHFRITMSAFWCDLDTNTDAGTLPAERPMRWVSLTDLPEYPFPKANHKVFAKLGLVQE